MDDIHSIILRLALLIDTQTTGRRNLLFNLHAEGSCKFWIPPGCISICSINTSFRFRESNKQTPRSSHSKSAGMVDWPRSQVWATISNSIYLAGWARLCLCSLFLKWTVFKAFNIPRAHWAWNVVRKAARWLVCNFSSQILRYRILSATRTIVNACLQDFMHLNASIFSVFHND